jgi:BspA type Leucine rich repeat region (6 copies)
MIKIMKTKTPLAKTTRPNRMFGCLKTVCSVKLLPQMLFLLTFAWAANAGQSGDFTYSTDGTNVTITGYTGAGGAVDIPDTITNLPVVSIGDGAFSSQGGITSVTIPASVTNIGVEAFYDCYNLAGLVISASVTRIGPSAFASCTSLTGVTIPDSVTNLGASAFYDCTNLTQITIPNAVTSIGDFTFQNCTSLTNIMIPNTVTSIGRYAFEYCSDLTRVTIPASVTSLGSYVFGDCYSLTFALFQGNAPGSDGTTAFYGDTNMVVYYLSGTSYWSSTYDGVTAQALVAPGFFYIATNGVITITDWDGFSGTLAIPDTIGGLPVTSIGKSAFFNDEFLTNIVIPNSVTSIGDFAFFECYFLTSVTIPNNVTGIGNDAFYKCGDLTNLIIPESVTSIGNDAFAFCSSLTSIRIPNSVTSISSGTFANCDRLTSVTISAGVTSIGSGAFSDCTSLPNVVIPASVTNIGTNAFGSCYSLTSALFQGNAPSNDGTAFNGDANIVYYLSGTTGWGSNYGGVTAQALVVPGFEYTAANGVISISSYTGSGGAVAIPGMVGGLPVISIGADAFYNNTSLTSVTIPNSVTSIGQGAFAGCSDLSGVFFLGNAPGSGNDSSVFSSDTSVTVYYLPGTTGWGSMFDGVPAVLWNPQGTSFTIVGGQFGFNITGPTNATIVVEASTNLVHPIWIPVGTNFLTGGSSRFSDPDWTNYPGRFYRLSLP